jgi:hypothetical protein
MVSFPVTVKDQCPGRMPSERVYRTGCPLRNSFEPLALVRGVGTLRSMTYNPYAPATKHDVQLLVEHLGKLYVANREWKEEIVREVRRAAREIQPAANGSQHEERLKHLAL